jgi:signal transduction histidine kinase
MMRSLALKLILAFLAVSLTGTILVALFAGQATASEFGHFMFAQNQAAIVAQLADYYRTHGGWTGVEDALRSGGPMGAGGPRGMGQGGSVALADATGHVVVSGTGHRIGEQLSEAELAQGVPVEVEGQRVGTLIEGRGASGALNPAEVEFLDRVNRALVIAMLGATAVGLMLGALLARRLTRPLRELTSATRAVATGHLEQRVSVRSRDELGELAASFNQMSADLARARDQRRQMTADIAHDLRTPLSVILGHAEALRDGVMLPTPETLSLVHDEAVRLNRLVEDLRTLSLAEAGELKLVKRLVSPRALVERAAAAYGPRALQQSVSLRTDLAPDLPDIEVDPDRMAQVLGNLLDNALRHTPGGGVISIQSSVASRRSPESKQIADQWLLIAVKDTGPGIAPEDLPRVFDRFYRADKARQRDTGGSGLGLSIVRSIVESHGGRIWVESTPGHGAMFVIELPSGSASS